MFGDREGDNDIKYRSEFPWFDLWLQIFQEERKSFFPFSVVFQGLDNGPGIMKADQEHAAEWIETILNLVPLQSQNNQLGNCERSEPLSTLRL